MDDEARLGLEDYHSRERQKKSRAKPAKKSMFDAKGQSQKE